MCYLAHLKIWLCSILNTFSHFSHSESPASIFVGLAEDPASEQILSSSFPF